MPVTVEQHPPEAGELEDRADEDLPGVWQGVFLSASVWGGTKILQPGLCQPGKRKGGKTGFDPPEIETLFNKVHSKEVKEDNFDVESELKQPCFSKEGDIWMLGKHRVLCGDSTKAESYDTLMDGVKANLVLSDPPYNVDVEETAGKILNDNMGDSEFYEFLLSAFKQMHDHLADDGSIYIFHAGTEGLNFRKVFKDAGFYLSGCCIWKKNALVLGRSPY